MNNMTVKDFMEYSVDGNLTSIELWDANNDCCPTIYKGLYMNMPCKYDNSIVKNFDMYGEENLHNESKRFISFGIK